MQCNIFIDQCYRRWSNVNSGTNEVWAVGRAWYAGELYDSNGLAKLAIEKFGSNLSSQSTVNFARDLNGTFAIIVKSESEVALIVDRVRSVPLFYALENDYFFASNSAQLLATRLKNTPLINENSLIEFMHVGYVTGIKTVYLDVSQVQAGEVIFVDRKTKVLQRIQYYEFTHGHYSQASKDDLAKKLADILDTVFDRVVKELNGRQAVIPLSGGWDSRLVAAMLKKKGVKNICCFSYGSIDSEDTRISRQVAESLGYDWHFVQYTPDQWTQWINSEWMKKYWKYAFNSVSLPVFQDGPAVYALKEKGVLTKDALFIPGHSGDFLSGSHIPVDCFEQKSLTMDGLLTSIIKKHYYFWEGSGYLRQCKDKLADQFALSKLLDKKKFADAFECWDWKERQAKYIINSCRLYEFFGHDWMIPLWDSELMDFFQKTPLNLRIDQNLYFHSLAKWIFSDDAFQLRNIPIADNHLSPLEIVSNEVQHQKVSLPNKLRNQFKYLLSKAGMLETIRKISGRVSPPHEMGFHHWFTQNQDPCQITFARLINEDLKRGDPLEQWFLRRYGNKVISNLDCLGVFAFIFAHKFIFKKECDKDS